MSLLLATDKGAFITRSDLSITVFQRVRGLPRGEYSKMLEIRKLLILVAVECAKCVHNKESRGMQKMFISLIAFVLLKKSLKYNPLDCDLRSICAFRPKFPHMGQII